MRRATATLHTEDSTPLFSAQSEVDTEDMEATEVMDTEALDSMPLFLERSQVDMVDTVDTADMAMEALDWMLRFLERSQAEMITRTEVTGVTEAQDSMLQFSVRSRVVTATTEDTVDMATEALDLMPLFLERSLVDTADTATMAMEDQDSILRSLERLPEGMMEAMATTDTEAQVLMLQFSARSPVDTEDMVDTAGTTMVALDSMPLSLER